MQCSSNIRQLGIAVHNFESAHKKLPAGFTSHGTSGEPGWGWATYLLPFAEGGNLYNNIDLDVAIEEDIHEMPRSTVLSLFICPSDPWPNQFEIAEGHGHDHDHDHMTGLGDRIDDDEHKLFQMGKSNYVAMFGTFELEDAPYNGNGMFFGNSRTKFRDVVDGLSNTLMIGERSGRLGGSVWAGNIPEAAESYARILGVADHGPNDPHSHFEDFGSYHTGGVNFMRADTSTFFLPDTIDLRVYQAMSTRNGGEVESYVD
jgi:hypothetical protein